MKEEENYAGGLAALLLLIALIMLPFIIMWSSPIEIHNVSNIEDSEKLSDTLGYKWDPMWKYDPKYKFDPQYRFSPEHTMNPLNDLSPFK